MELHDLINKQKGKLQSILAKTELALGEIIFNNNDCQVLSQSAVRFELFVDSTDSKSPVECSLDISEEDLIPLINGAGCGWERVSYACLLEIENELKFLDPKEPVEMEEESVAVEQASGKQTVVDEKAQEIEQVMNNGMQFLAGLFKMSTGKDLEISGQSVEINKETGEMVMKFKLPF